MLLYGSPWRDVLSLVDTGGEPEDVLNLYTWDKFL